jgi:hypothetical protein
MDRLAAAGRLRLPAGDLLDVPPPRGRATNALSDAITRGRQERIVD